MNLLDLEHLVYIMHPNHSGFFIREGVCET